MKVWIDLANSPHPLVFAPVARRLERDGHEVLITARDNAQTVELALERWPDIEVIGGESPKGKPAKLAAIGRRVAGLRRWALGVRPDVALSHNSYAQIVAARGVRVPAVTAMDFEHQPANHVAFRLAKVVLLPEVLPRDAVRRQGALPRKVTIYEGLKEELYIGDFEPDPAIVSKIGLEARPKILVVVRTPPTRAVYHGFANPLFEQALRTICSQEDLVCVALTRHAEQTAAIESLQLRNCLVPHTAIDSRSLMYEADVMIGAGGTMTREAALMGIPTWTMFAGATPAVDMWLERQGMLARLSSAEQLARLETRSHRPRTPSQFRERAEAIETVVVGATVAACQEALASVRPWHRRKRVSDVYNRELLPPMPAGATTNADEAVLAARALEHWGHSRGWRGSDPYDALNATRLIPQLRRSPLAARILTQTVKRSPLNLRPLLGIASGLSAVTLAHVISAYARNGFLDPEDARAKLHHSIERLAELRCPTFTEPCWGYHFDVQTRVLFYPRTTPNTIATAFAGLGLLDAYELAGVEKALELAIGAGEFFIRHVPQTQTVQGAYFGYLPGDRTPIHNSNMLVCALLARLACLTGSKQFGDAARESVEYTITRQRPDGSWPYGEEPHLQWIDGFHTGYVLDCLLACVGSGVGGEGADQAWRLGLRYYVHALIERDGIPTYTPSSRYPIDGQCAAQAIRTLSRVVALEPELATRRWDVFRFAGGRFRRGDGSFAFQRERFWTNRMAHPRWVEAPMLAALTELITT
jgi:predicted glycosyltransferase